MIYDVEIRAVIASRIDATTEQEALDKLRNALWSVNAEGQVSEIDVDTRQETAIPYVP